MADHSDFDNVLTRAYKRMHRYTCAESSLQALMELWGLPAESSWATAGYMGAIMSGKTTCGLLIGSSIAISLKCRGDCGSVPEEHERERGRAIEAVSELYSDFLTTFGSAECKDLSKTDFSVSDELAQYIAEKKWKSTCDLFLDHVIRKCVEMEERGALR